MSLSAIRDALKTGLETISGLKVYDTAPESIGELPAAYIVPKSGSYDFAGGGAHIIYQLEVVLLINRSQGIAEAQDDMDAYINPTGSSSVKATIEAANLGANASVARVTGFADYGGLDYAGQIYLGTKFAVEVFV